MTDILFSPDGVATGCAAGCQPCIGCCDCPSDVPDPRAQLRRWAWLLTALTIGWNAAEALVGTISGLLAHSIALVGYGLDSIVEVTSALIVTWRLTRHSADDEAEERAERRASRLIALSLCAIAVYVAGEAVAALQTGDAPSRSPAGLLVVALSLVMMPVLARAKRRVAGELGSPTLHADAAQTQICFYLAAAVLVGLVASAWGGLWWMDPLAGFVVAGLALREGYIAWRSGELCADDDCAPVPGLAPGCLPTCCPACAAFA